MDRSDTRIGVRVGSCSSVSYYGHQPLARVRVCQYGPDNLCDLSLWPSRRPKLPQAVRAWPHSVATVSPVVSASLEVNLAPATVVSTRPIPFPLFPDDIAFSDCHSEFHRCRIGASAKTVKESRALGITRSAIPRGGPTHRARCRRCLRFGRVVYRDAVSEITQKIVCALLEVSSSFPSLSLAHRRSPRLSSSGLMFPHRFRACFEKNVLLELHSPCAVPLATYRRLRHSKATAVYAAHSPR